MIRILIAEDQVMLRGALTALLQMEEDMEVIAQVSDGRTALTAIEKDEPSICILDIEMPELNGLEVALEMRRKNLDCKIIIITTFARPGYLHKAREIKVEGYLLKDEPIDFVVHAIRKVMNGESVVSTELATTLFDREESPLTEREEQVLLLVKEGKSTGEIGRELYLTNGTVRNYLSSAIQKMEVETRHHAIQKAVEKGWI